LKDYKAEYRFKKERFRNEIADIHHKHDGILGYRNIRVFLERKNIHISNPTVHKYMNTELG